MATFTQWIKGARPHTFAHAAAPIFIGTGAAAWAGSFLWWKTLLLLVLSVSFTIGVNYANDYSDGIRGADNFRIDSIRLVGSRLTRPNAVLVIAILIMAICSINGFIIVLITSPIIGVIGLVCIFALWFYTGGNKPYGYQGYGEIVVFIFFGLVGTLGTQYIQSLHIDWVGLVIATVTGLLSAAVLTINNLRDIFNDSYIGKNTLAVKFGDTRTRILYQAIISAVLVISALIIITTKWYMLVWFSLFNETKSVKLVRSGSIETKLNKALLSTELTILVWSIITSLNLFLA